MDAEISIIIPVYNTQNYLGQCLESLFIQTFQNFEIICVDDGSSDNSLEILKKYEKKFKNFKILKQNHQGASEARNLGLEYSKGRYVQFLDSDDYFEPCMLEKLYQKIIDHNCDIAVCSSRKVNNKGVITESKNPNSPINLNLTPLNKPFNYRDFKNDIFSLLTPVPWNKLFSKEMLIKNNIKFPKLNISEDVAFVNCAVICAQKIVVFNEELINYRFNRPLSMASYRSKYTIDTAKAMIILKEFLIRKDLYGDVENAFIKAFKNHIRWEIALCNSKEYETFLVEFKNLVKDDFDLFKPALKKDFLNFNYLKNFIKDKKVMLWGASFFIQKMLEKEEKKDNILGIIDNNEALWGKTFANYKVYPPKSLKDLKPEGVIMTVWSNWEENYPLLKKEFEKKYPNIELMENIFEKEPIV